MQNNRYSDNRYIGYENLRFQYQYRFINNVVSVLKTQNCCIENFNLHIYKIVNACIYETDWPMQHLPIRQYYRHQYRCCQFQYQYQCQYNIGHCNSVPEIRFVKYPDEMSEQDQNCSDIMEF